MLVVYKTGDIRKNKRNKKQDTCSMDKNGVVVHNSGENKISALSFDQQAGWFEE